MLDVFHWPERKLIVLERVAIGTDTFIPSYTASQALEVIGNIDVTGHLILQGREIRDAKQRYRTTQDALPRSPGTRVPFATGCW